MIRFTFFALLLPLLAGAPVRPAPAKAHDVDAEIARAMAVESIKAKRFDDALAAANKAAALEPKWADVYFVRASAYTAVAGPDSEKAALVAPRVGADYDKVAHALDAAADDLKTFLTLDPATSDRALVITAIADLRTRAQTARDFGARMPALLAEQRKREDDAKSLEQAHAEDLRLLAAGRAKIDASHWCFPGQVWNVDRCLGSASRCPVGWAPDPQAGCALVPCKLGRTQFLVDPATTETRCCWPGQTWSKERAGQYPYGATAGCIGPPSCPAGTAPRPDLGFAETCIPFPVRARSSGDDRECEYRTNAAGKKVKHFYVYSVPSETLEDLTGTSQSAYEAMSANRSDRNPYVSIANAQATADGCEWAERGSSGASYCCP